MAAKSFRIRDAREADLAAVLAIERESFSNPWPESHFQTEFALSFSTFSVAVPEGADEEVAGFIIFWTLAGTVELHNIAVGKAWRQCGVASRLISFLLDKVGGDAEEVFLEVRESNAAAIRLYENFGFRKQGRRKGYYTRPPEDALVFGLTLKKSPASP